MEPVERCRRFLAALGPAIQGQGGDAHTFKACCSGNDFGLTEVEFVPLLRHWNGLCQPPWPWTQLLRKYRSASRRRARRLGWRLQDREASDGHVNSPAPLPPPRMPAGARRSWASSNPTDADLAVATFLRSRGLSAAKLADLDLARALGECSEYEWARVGGRGWRQAGYLLILPLFDQHGAMRSVRARQVADQPGPKSVSPCGFETGGLVLADAMAVLVLKRGGHPCWDGRIVVVEGEVDFLTWAASWGCAAENVPATIGLSAGAWTPEIGARVPDRAEILLRTHLDGSGESYAKRVAADLQARCVLRRLQP